MKYFYISIILFALIFCSSEKDKEFYSDYPEKEYTITDDSLFFGNVQDMYCKNDTAYMLDPYNTLIYRLLPDYTLKNVFPYQKGKGPGELLWPTYVNIFNDTIFIADARLKKFNMYNMNFEYLNSIFIPKTFSGKGMVFDSEGNIHYPSFKIVKINRLTREIKEYGELLKFNGKPNKYRSAFHIVKSNNYLLAISEAKPLIRVYDFNGNLKKSIDVSWISKLNKSIRAHDEFYKNATETATGILFYYAYVSNEYLYILYKDYTGDRTKNYFLKFSIIGTKLNYLGVINLKTRQDISLSSFVITSDNRLITFDYLNRKVLVFNLNSL